MNPPRTRQRYTQEFKQDAVQMVLEHGYSCAEAARRLGTSAPNVVRWVRQHRENAQAIDEGQAEPNDLKTELKRLRKENQRLRMEREILKKATAFFANESDSGSSSSGTK